MTLSRNEVQALVLKAARGGGLPLGYAEDLAAAAGFVDLARLAQCPCQGAAADIPVAIDLAVAGAGAQQVQAEPALIAAYIAMAEAAFGRAIAWDQTADGGVVHGFAGGEAVPHEAAARCHLPDSLHAHLQELAARTLVPETAQSRQAGAGAGLTDND